MSGLRLRLFIVNATSFEPVTGLAHGDVTSAAYRTSMEDGSYSASSTTITLTSTAAVSAAVATGQWIEFGNGEYGLDVGTLPTDKDYIEAVVSVTDCEVYVTRHRIDYDLDKRTERKTDVAIQIARHTGQNTA